MDDLDELLARVATQEVQLGPPNERHGFDAADAVLFDAVQVPLVALTTLACLSSHGSSKIPLPEIGLRVGAALMAAFPQFGKVGRRLQWSLRVRAGTADAMTFLEASDLAAVVEGERGRTLTMTASGRAFLANTRKGDSDVSHLVNLLRSAAERTRDEELSLV